MGEKKLDYKVIPVGKANDIRGQVFGRLKVLERVEKPKELVTNKTYWLCECECGNLKITHTSSLTQGNTKSCGCLQKEAIYKTIAGNKGKVRPLIVDLTGEVFNRLTVIGEHSRTTSSKVVWLCKCECGEETYVTTNHLRSGNTQSCGCLRKDTGLKFKGSNHPQWRHDLSTEDRANHEDRRYSPEYSIWRRKVYKSDNYTCQCCGNRTRKGNAVLLNAHHLNSWNAYPEQRFDIGNGVTLCTNCHTNFHQQYGYGDNTKEQYEEWITCNEYKTVKNF